MLKFEKGRKTSQSLRPDESGSSERNRTQIRRVRGGSDGSVSVLFAVFRLVRTAAAAAMSLSIEQLENVWAEGRHG